MSNKRYVRINNEVHDITQYVHSCFIFAGKDKTTTELCMSKEIDLPLIGNKTWIEWEDGTIGREHIITNIMIPNKNIQEYADTYRDPVLHKVALYRKSHTGGRRIVSERNPIITLNIGRGWVLHLERVWWYEHDVPSFTGEDIILTITDADGNVLTDSLPDIKSLNKWIEELQALANPKLEDIIK